MARLMVKGGSPPKWRFLISVLVPADNRYGEVCHAGIWSYLSPSSPPLKALRVPQAARFPVILLVTRHLSLATALGIGSSGH